MRYYRLKMDLAEISFEGWCLAALATVVVAGFAVAIGLAIEAIGSIDDLLTKALASVGLAGVPLSFILWAIKVRCSLRARSFRLKRMVTTSNCHPALKMSIYPLARAELEFQNVSSHSSLSPASTRIYDLQIMPAAFRSQGEAILNRATSMDASVGSTRLGFMADVQEEIQV